MHTFQKKNYWSNVHHALTFVIHVYELMMKIKCGKVIGFQKKIHALGFSKKFSLIQNFVKHLLDIIVFQENSFLVLYTIMKVDNISVQAIELIKLSQERVYFFNSAPAIISVWNE